MSVIQVDSWNRFPWLRHGFSTRSGVSTVYDPAGDLNLGYTREDDPASVEANRASFLTAVGSSGLVTLRQIHSDAIVAVRAAGSAGEGDGLITDKPGITLGILTADCTPVLIADTQNRVVAAFHAGWRGTVAGIVERGVSKMVKDYGSDPSHVVAAVGPAIGGCCYTVGTEVEAQFGARFSYAAELFRNSGSSLFLDLAEANRRQLLAAGLSAASITVLAQCTACARDGERRRFFSHRAERGFTGRMMSAIAIVS